MQEIGTFPIRLNDKPYYIEIGSWKARDVTDFSPKTTVPGTGAVFGDLQLYQPISQTNWQHGMGFIWHEDEAGYLSTLGNIDTRHKGAVMLMTDGTSSDTNDNVKEGGLVFGSNFLTWGDAGVRGFVSSAWQGINVQRPLFDSASEGSATGVADAGTITVSHTVTEEIGNNYVLAGVMVDDGDGDFTDEAGMESGISATFGGTAMSVITGSAEIETTSGQGIVVLGLAGATAGSAQDCVVTLDNSSGGTMDVVVVVASFVNVHQSSPTATRDATMEGTGTAATQAIISPTSSDDDLVVDFLAKEGTESGDSAAVGLTGALTGNSQVEIAQDDEGTDDHLCVSYFYTEAADTTPSLQWDWTNARDYAHTAIVLQPIAETTVNFMFENGEFVFCQPNGGRLMKSENGTQDWLPAGLNNASNAYTWLEIHGGYIFGGKSAEAEVYFDTNSDLSALAGDPGDDSDELVAGPGTVGTIKGISFLEKLAVSRQDGLWTMDTDDATTTNWISKRTLNFKNLRSSVNFRDMATWGGSLYFSIQDKLLYQWNGAKLQNITPAPVTDAWEYTVYYRFDNFTPFGDWLLMTARTSATLTGHTGYSEAILAWDGVGFHKLLEPITDGDGTISALAIDTANEYIWYHVQKPTASTNTTSYIQYQPDSDFPYANYPTSGTHRLTSSRIHAGFRRVDKSMAALWIEVDNLTSTRTIEVQYAVDDSGTFQTWRTLDSNGEHVLYLPQNQLTEEFKYIRFRFIFVTDSASETPVLEGYALMVMMRPDYKMGYTFDVIGGTNTASGMHEDERTGYSIMHDLREARDEKSPIPLVTPFGDEVWGYLTAITENAVEYEPENMEGGDVNILQVIRCNFVETLVVEGTELDVDPAW